MISASKPRWQQVTALVSLGASGTITGFSFVPASPAELTSPASMPIRLTALERSSQAAPADDATLRSAIVNVASYYLRMAQGKTPAQMEAIIWQHDSIDGVDHGASCAAFASLTLELAAQVVGQQSWVTGGTSYPWPLHKWADVRVDPNPDSPGIMSVLQDAQDHGRWHALSDGYVPQPGDWVLFDGHVEVVTKYAGGMLYTIGGDSLPNFSVNAHQYSAPFAAQGIAGFVNNGNLPAVTADVAAAGHGDGARFHHARGQAAAALASIPGTAPASSPGSAGAAPPAATPADPAGPAPAGGAVIPGMAPAPGRGQGQGQGQGDEPGGPTGPGTGPGSQQHRRHPLRPHRHVAHGPGHHASSPASPGPGAGRTRSTPPPASRPAHSGAAAQAVAQVAGGADVPGLTAPGANAGRAKPADGQPAAGVPGVAVSGPAAAPKVESAGAAAIPGLAGPPASAPAYRRHPAAAGASPGPVTDAQQAFIDAVAPGAIATQRAYGVPAAVTIAQAIDESGWGQSELAVRDHNLFGIKGTGPAGTDALATQEFENGQWISTTAGFRVYNNVAQSISDHGALLATSGYYTQAMADRGNPDSFASALTGVYATNPQYGADLIGLMQQYDLYRYDATAPRLAPPAHRGPEPRGTSAARPRPTSPASPARPSRPGPAPTPVVSPGTGAPGGTTPTPTPTAPTPAPGQPSPPAPGQPSAPAPGQPSPPAPGQPTTAAPVAKATSPALATGPAASGGSPAPTAGSPAPGTSGAGATGPAPTAGHRAAGAGQRAPSATPRSVPSRTPGRAPSGAPRSGPARTAGPAPSGTAPGGGGVAATPSIPGVPPVPAAGSGSGTAHSTTSAATSGQDTTSQPATLTASYRSLAAESSPAPASPARAAAAASTPAPGPAASRSAARPALYQPQLPASVKNGFVALAKAPLTSQQLLYQDVARHTGIPWQVLAACDWMQCDARPSHSPVHGERLGSANPNGTVYRTKSEALEQCACDLADLAQEVYQVDLAAPGGLSVADLANVFAAFRWGRLLRWHNTSAMEFPYSVAGLTVQHLSMRWPNIDEPKAPDRPGARFRLPFGAVPVVLSLGFPATV